MNIAQSQVTRKTPTTYAKTGLTALFIFPKVARPSSSLKQFSASMAGFSSLSAAEGEGGGPMRLKNKDKQMNARILTLVLTVKQNRFLLLGNIRMTFSFYPKITLDLNSTS